VGRDVGDEGVSGHGFGSGRASVVRFHLLSGQTGRLQGRLQQRTKNLLCGKDLLGAADVRLCLTNRWAPS
jgi:hypothetical protein